MRAGQLRPAATTRSSLGPSPERLRRLGLDPAACLGAARHRLVHQLRHALGQAGQAHGAAVHGRAAERRALAQACRGGAHGGHKLVVHALLRPPTGFSSSPQAAMIT
jgi:hypothetical protein